MLSVSDGRTDLRTVRLWKEKLPDTVNYRNSLAIGNRVEISPPAPARDERTILNNSSFMNNLR